MFAILFWACTSSKGSNTEDSENESASPNSCIQLDLGSELGTPVISGAIQSGVGNFGYCGERVFGPGNDTGGGGGWSGIERVYAWTAPASSTYTIYTYGSTYDTTLSLKSTCQGSAIDCDDDGGLNLDSLITFSAEAGQPYVIILDAYSAYESGDWYLNIIEGTRENIDFPADTGGWYDTGDWGDSGWSDTGGKGHRSTQSYGCAVQSWGLCYELLPSTGWTKSIGQESCAALSDSYQQKSHFHSGLGCKASSAVGECQMTYNSTFEDAFVVLYHQRQWTASQAEAACSSAGGQFFKY